MMYQVQLSYHLIKEIDDSCAQLIVLSLQLIQWYDVMNCLHSSNPFWKKNESSLDTNNSTHNTVKLFTTFPSTQFPIFHIDTATLVL